MTTYEFFKYLLEEGSIDNVYKKYPELTRNEVDFHFNRVFEQFNDSFQDAVYELYTDGASKGNPGYSGIGFVIKKEGCIIEEKSEYIGITTNNVAEYTALLRGLERAHELGIKNIRVFSDSELMVKQINGIYSIKNEKLKGLAAKIMHLITTFDSFVLKHIPREENKLADKLSKDGSLNHFT